MSKSHGAASNNQFVQIMYAIGSAVAEAAEDFSVKELINALGSNGAKLVGFMRLVFTALMTGQGLALQPIALSFPTWKTIKLGTLKNVDAIRQALKAQGYSIGNWASDILGKPAFTLASQETDIELVLVTVAELEFKNGATRKDIYDRALGQGLALCPNEVGPQLRLQYADQPMDELMLVAMEPITDSGGDLRVFGVGHDSDGRWLGVSGKSGRFWNADNRWVFARRNALHFSPDALSGEFCFPSWPFHPPSILPISSRSMDRAAYFLLSSDFDSHSTISNTLRVSSFLMPRRT